MSSILKVDNYKLVQVLHILLAALGITSPGTVLQEIHGVVMAELFQVLLFKM